MCLAPKGEVVMTISRIAGLFLAVAVSVLTPGSATAGWDEGVAAYDRGDYHAAFREFMALAVAGYSSAQLNIGVMYASGQGVPQNYAEAVRWFRRAADHGEAQAQSNLGVMYERGQGVPQNYAEAMRWYRMAADQGNANAQWNLSVMYRRGQGVPQDDAEAARWSRRAAERGHASAQSYLGLMYELGRGVKQDHIEAVRWYKMAADQGDGLAQYLVASSYFKGVGVPQDHAQAYIYANLAAAGLQGEDRKAAAMLRDHIASQLSPAQRARAREIARNWRPESQPVTQVASPPRALTHEEVLGKSAAVEDVQAKLAALAYDPGPADGVMGPKTRAAIRAFQADFGLPVD